MEKCPRQESNLRTRFRKALVGVALDRMVERQSGT
jgi:hypothetical protein